MRTVSGCAVWLGPRMPLGTGRAHSVVWMVGVALSQSDQESSGGRDELVSSVSLLGESGSLVAWGN